MSSRVLLFFAFQLPFSPCIGDFCDSITLYRWREGLQAFRTRDIRQALSAWRSGLHYLLLERYSSRRYAANLLVSPVDKAMFDRIGDAAKNVLLTNGVSVPPELPPPSKVPFQIVFSGVMNFPPNYESAMWFLDRVFPQVLARIPQAVFVAAGADPHPLLRARASASVRVPGFVEDLSRTISDSALYVAPLVSGSGFKNKVVEAAVSGTYIIGTSLAVEFLDPPVRDLITVCDDPAVMADAICRFFERPEAFSDKLAALRRQVSEEFSWTAKALDLARLAAVLIEKDRRKL